MAKQRILYKKCTYYVYENLRNERKEKRKNIKILRIAKSNHSTYFVCSQQIIEQMMDHTAIEGNLKLWLRLYIDLNIL